MHLLLLLYIGVRGDIYQFGKEETVKVTHHGCLSRAINQQKDRMFFCVSGSICRDGCFGISFYCCVKLQSS